MKKSRIDIRNSPDDPSGNGLIRSQKVLERSPEKPSIDLKKGFGKLTGELHGHISRYLDKSYLAKVPKHK